MSNGKKKSFPRISFGENTGVFLVAFGLAVIIWIFAKAGETEEASGILVPVGTSPTDARLQVTVDPPVVPVTLRYPKEMQGYISSENFRFDVDISDLRTGLGLDWRTKSQPLTEKNWTANIPDANRIQVLKIGTHTKTVEVRVRWNAQVALVEPDIVGEDRLPDGMQLVTPVKVTPREVWIVGSPAALDTVPRDDATSKPELKTERVNVAERSQSGAETVAIKLPPGVDLVQPTSRVAEVSIEIQETQAERVIRGVPLTLTALFPDTMDVQYSPRNATVTVSGPQSLLRQLTPQSFEITMIRPAEEMPGTTKDVALEAQFGAGVNEETRRRLTVKSVEPASVRVSYVAKPASAPPR
jgi:YbbR domain-containing protein